MIFFKGGEAPSGKSIFREKLDFDAYVYSDSLDMDFKLAIFFCQKNRASYFSDEFFAESSLAEKYEFALYGNLCSCAVQFTRANLSQ